MASSNTSPTSSTETMPTVELNSPTVSTRFSQADTLLTHESNYTSNTGGRARRSWHRLNTFFSNDPQTSSHRQPNGTTNSSPTGPHLVRQARERVVELPATPVAHPDEPRSFFDSQSDTDSDGEPVISRASSVRVQRPHIVQNGHSANHHSIRIVGEDHLAPPLHPSGSLSKAQQILGHPLTSLSIDQTAESPLPSSQAKEGLKVINADATEHASLTALPPTPHSQQSSIKEDIVQVPDSPSGAEALDTLPTPTGMDGFGSLRLNPLTLDGLRSNPPNFGNENASHLIRAISAPPLPNRHPHRKVTIRPSDLVITDSAGHHRLFRQSVVSTPYPTRTGNVKNAEEAFADALAATKSPIPTHPIPVPPPSSQSDRFPSPIRSEILFLTLSLSRHPHVQTTVEIAIRDRATFDDEALFHTLRHAYKTDLLGLARRIFAARSLLHHSTSTFSPSPFDSADFLHHLSTPKLGHKRKSWLVWLRRHQQQQQQQQQRRPSPPQTTSVGNVKTGGSIIDEKSVDSLATFPRMPFTDLPSAISTSPLSTTTISFSSPPRIELHFTFSPFHLALSIFSVLTLSCLSTVLWVLFGFPGGRRRVGQHDGGGGDDGVLGLIGPVVAYTWRADADAEARVLTGLVLGVFVFLLGGMMEVGWVCGSWVLL